ncbi:uncharacterized protein LOC144312139 [Canis aureus]
MYKYDSFSQHQYTSFYHSFRLKAFKEFLKPTACEEECLICWKNTLYIKEDEIWRMRTLLEPDVGETNKPGRTKSVEGLRKSLLLAGKREERVVPFAGGNIHEPREGSVHESISDAVVWSATTS